MPVQVPPGLEGHAGVTRGQEPPSPPRHEHTCLCAQCIYIYLYLYIYIHLHASGTPLRGGGRRCPPGLCPPCPYVSLHAHVCTRVSPHAGAPPAPLRTHGTGVRPTGVHGPPPSTHTGGAWVPPKAITSCHPTACGCRGGTPRPPRAPTKERQPMGVPLRQPPSCAPPSQDTLGRGGRPQRNFGFSLGFFSNKDVKASRVQCLRGTGGLW